MSDARDESHVPEGWSEMSRPLPSTNDDNVTITRDGRRLDTKEKVIEFFAELEAEREAERDRRSIAGE